MMSQSYQTFLDKVKQLPTYTTTEVAQHHSIQDPWIILTDLFEGVNQPLVCDLKTYIRTHPGGVDIILPYLGSDATEPFLSYHVEGTSQRYELVMQMVIGTLEKA